MQNLLLERLGEASTWRGLVWIATALGASLNPEQTDAIATAGAAVAGALAIFTKG